MHPLPSSSSLLLTLDEVAADLRCTRRHVENLIKRGEIDRVRIGGCVRIRRRDLESYIDEHLESA